MYTDKTYYVNEISLPNLGSSIQLDVLTSRISRYEPEILKDALGYTLYGLLLSSSTDQRMKDIVEGKEFTFELNGYTITRKWGGLQNSDKVSLLSYYVYYQLIVEKVTQTTTTGSVKPKNENSETESERAKLVDAWNRMVDLYGIPLCGYNKFDTDTYEYYNDKPSLYNFLLANKDTYPEWEFEHKRKINYFNV